MLTLKDPKYLTKAFDLVLLLSTVEALNKNHLNTSIFFVKIFH